MSLPALARLRAAFPQAHIALLAPPRSADVLSGSSLIDEVIVYRRRKEGMSAFLNTVRRLRQHRFDLAVLFQNAFEAALLAWMSGIRLRIGYDTQGRGLLLTHKLKTGEHQQNRHQTNDYLDLVRECERVVLGSVANVPSNNIPVLAASAEQAIAAEKLLAAYGIKSNDQSLIALNAGATNSRAKCWPEDRFAQLADKLVSEIDAYIVLIGAGSERENADRIISQMNSGNRAINLAGKTSIAELIGLLARCNLLVTNDTGPAHVAAALGTPTLTIFGPTNEFETAPLGLRSSIIRAEGIECARCMHRDCPIDHRCMTRISVDEVLVRGRESFLVRRHPGGIGQQNAGAPSRLG